MVQQNMIQQNQQPVSKMVDPKRSNSLLLVLSVLILIFVVGFSVYLNLQKNALTDEQARIKDDIGKVNADITELKSQNIEGAQLAQVWLDEIKGQEIRWSKVIEGITDLIPKDETSGKPIVNVLSYTGSSEGKVSLNIDSGAQTLNTFENVAKLISAFNSNSLFHDPIVPSISRGETDEGDIKLSFGMTVNYQEEQESLATLTGGDAGVAGSTQVTDTNSALPSTAVEGEGVSRGVQR